MTDREIIKGIISRSPVAERNLYRRNKKKCIRYAKGNFFGKTAEGQNIRCSIEDAEELYNDACALLIQNIYRERVQELAASISSYLITSMKYGWLNKVRSLKPSYVEQSAKGLSIDQKEAIRAKVRRLIHQLDPKCREMMTYRYILGWEDYEDIAMATQKNNGAVVRNLISRCRKRFRELYDRDEDKI